MHWFFLAIILVCIFLLASQSLTRVDPRALAKGIRIGSALIALAVAALLFFVGRAGFAFPLAALAFMLLGRGMSGTGGFRFPGGQARKSQGQQSRVATDWLEMNLDHDSGDLTGKFLKGPLAGQALEALGRTELIGAYDELLALDTQSAQLVMTFLDRRFEGWQDESGHNRRAGEGESVGGSSGPMGRAEAYEVLGLQRGASDKDIRTAHRSLMKKLHPDQGGSTILAAKVNQAKDVLLNRR